MDVLSGHVGWAPRAHDADHWRFGDLKVIIALYAVRSIRSTQRRPVCSDISSFFFFFFYKGILFHSLLTLGTWSETQHCPPVYFCICYSKLPVIESCSPGLPDVNGAGCGRIRSLVTVVKGRGVILGLLRLRRVTPDRVCFLLRSVFIS